ncbi:MAG: TIGR04282 family arsenosugar biosynthesis glycosyltransferase [Ferruginibacter sp.]
MKKQALIIFAKNPEPGKVKTRLAATIGNEAALIIYNKLLHHTVSVTKYLAVDKFVFYSDHLDQDDIWNKKHYYKEIQQGNNLGQKMENALASTFQKGYDEIVIIGTDCPGVNAGIIMNSFSFLQSHDVAIGPAEDGGYYLLGMKEMHRNLFEGIQWSTKTVFSTTISKCVALQLSYSVLPLLKDIDEEKDLEEFKLYQL